MDNKENQTRPSVTEVRIVPVEPNSQTSAILSKDEAWKKDALRERLAEEQDYLRVCDNLTYT